MERYFEITVCEGDYRLSRRYTDRLLRAIKIPLGSFIEQEIEAMRITCVEKT